MNLKRDFIYDPSLVLYLPLYELDGASFLSRDAYGHLCTATGAGWRLQGRNFDGLDDKVTFPDTGFPSGNSSRTVLMWVNLDALKDKQAFMEYGNRVNDQAILFYAMAGAPDQLYVGKYGANASAGAVALVALTWQLIGFTFDGTQTITYYLDGAALGTATLAGIGTVLDHCYIGDGWNVADNFDGVMGEVWVYNRALTLAEIQHNYLATKWRYQ